MADAIRVRAGILACLREEAVQARSQECCGLLAGCDGIVTAICPAENALASATGYEIAPEKLFRIFREIRKVGLEFMGIYHSHPKGENCPSRRDIECAYYPDVPYFILSPLAHAPQPIRAFTIRDGLVEELDIESG